ncbi:MAG: NAD(P)/FAD-dependent oxidoreductase [Ignavibacteria bacterium]|nr:NAD(P)/FAD-dependent oxidoreductase [Ignavibacteria bacterium]MBT8381297.1 NAD(P)/FAD-dependent oxidoreductase [Ignavibacteria bacterium]MBT8390775.1 NAD(P)/FAD-dependent oxidoreductase [Ignavibacteria bacterium]NNL20147.1 NAD(P)/FAD-dependent oxidoreductase [Ignavibacteriaceae bacterium]
MKTSYDIIVVGAGPAGSMAARFAAEKDVSVLMLEKDRDVGYPVRCGEAISKAGVEEFIPSDEKWIAAKISKFSFNAPDGTEVILDFGEAGYVLERRIFDYELARTAADAGVEIVTRAYVNGLLFENGKVCGVKYEHQGEQKELKAKVVVAADGVESRVGRWAGLKTHIDFRDMESAVQITAANIPVDQNALYFFFGKDVAPNGYFWIFPKGNNKANIGLGVSGIIGKKKSAQSYLNDFMNKHYPNAPVLTTIAGGVPCAVTLGKISAPGILLVGDAAKQVNPLSGGGIASGMIGGKIAGTIAAEAVKMNKLDHILKYDKTWADRLGKRHETFDRIKNGIYNFSDEKFNNIAHAVNKIPYEKRTLGKVFKTALFNQPSLLIDVAKVFII